MPEFKLKIGHALLWVLIYLGIMLFYTFLDVAVWRKAFPKISSWLNILTIISCISAFCYALKRTGYTLQIFTNITPLGILAAIACSILFFLILDKGLDPIFESIFPQSEQSYRETIQSLIRSPVTSLLQVCIIAPFIEEILMRGLVLGGLQNTYGALPALLLSAVFFALLHFNMVQTLSAMVCGIILGLLYLKTNSIFCCMIAHCGYNTLSYITLIYPHLNK